MNEHDDNVEIESIRHVLSLFNESVPVTNDNGIVVSEELAVLYAEGVLESLMSLGLGSPHDVERIEALLRAGDADLSYFAARSALNSLRVRLRVLELEREGALAPDVVEIDDNWKSTIQSYLERIREIVRGVDIEEGLRERIMSKIGELSAEVERNRTNVRRYGELWLEITEVTGEGARNLKPVFELLRRVSGSVKRLKNAPIEQRLPSPEQMQLPSPESGRSEED